MVDPKNPGAVDEIIHLGDYWNEEGIRRNREGVMRDNREVGRLFARAYRYIKAAASIYEDTAVINGWAMDNAKANRVSAEVLAEVFGRMGTGAKEGRQRRLFASAITPDGLRNYLPTVLTTGRVYAVKGQQGTGTEKLMEKVKAEALEKGCYVEGYYCALNPSRLEHLVIPELDIAFTTVNEYHNAGVDACAEVNLDEYLDQSVLEVYSDVLEYNKAEFEALLNRAIFTIGKAKAVHDRMETYYIPNMDFEAVQRCWESTMERILAYAEECK